MTPLGQSDAVRELLTAARKVVSQAQRLADAEGDKTGAALCRAASDAITEGIAHRAPTGEVFACKR